MGKHIKSTGIILDASSMASAPVSPAGTVALRAKPDATQFQYSANGAAWTDFSGGGGGGFPRLDQVLDPGMAAPPTTTQIKAFSMTTHQLAFQFAGSDAEECFVIESAADAPGSGAVMLLRTLGASTSKSPLRIEGRGAFYMSVGVDGKVAIGTETGLANKLTIEHINTGGTEIGGMQCGVTLATGNTATSISNGIFSLSDNGNTSALMEMRALSLSLSRSSLAVTNVPLFTYLIDARAYFSADTGVTYGLFLKPIISNAATLTHWVGLHVETPLLLAGGTITNSKAIITAPGAGNVGLGLLTPAAQLHVSGTVQIDQSSTEAVTLYKYTTAATPFTLDFKRARGTSGSPSDLIDQDVAGRLLFQGRISGAFTQLGYLDGWYDTTLGGRVTLGAGSSFNQSRVTITETGSIGSVTLFGGTGGNYFQVQTSGFQFSHGTTGSTYYKSATGYFVDLAIGTVSQVLTVTDTGGGVLLPRWGAAPGGGSAPGGSATELQFRAGASTFGAVSNSAVSGANVTLGGTLSLDAAGSLDQTIVSSAISASDTKITFTEYRGSATPILLQFDRSRGTAGVPSNLSDADVMGELKWRGRVSGAFAQLGYLRGVYSATDGGTLQLGVGATSGAGTRFVATVNSGLGLFDTAGNFFTVSGSGFQFSHGSTGSIYYRSNLGLFTDLTIGSTSQYLKGGTIPSWGSLDAGHITSGTLALANGGTAAALTDPGADRILFWDESAGVVTWLEASTGLTITGTVMTAAGGAGGSPGGSASELQYRSSASTFGAVTNSAVSGANVTMGGTLTLDMASVADQSIVLSAISAADTKITFTEYRTATTPILLQFDRAGGTFASPANILNNYVLGEFRFRGRLAAAFAQQAYIRALYTTADLGQIEIGAGATSGTGTRFVATVQAGAGIFDAGGNSFTVSGSGFAFSHGATGSIYYRNSGGLFTALAIGTASQYLNGGTIPSWSGLNAGHITAGIVPLINGGTGNNLTDPGGDRILFWDDSAGTVTWLTAGSGLTITTTTMTATGGAPAGTGTELQYRNAGVFGAVANSGVSGANVTFGGSLTCDRAADANFKWVLSPLATDPTLTGVYNSNTANPLLIDFQRARGTGATNLSDEDYIGRIKFQGRVGGSLAEQCRIDGRYDADEGGGVLSMLAGTTTFGLYKLSGFYSTYTTATTNAVVQTHIRLLDSSGTPAAGLGMREIYQIDSSTTAAQLAAATEVRWQDATHASRSAVMGLRTVHKGNIASRERVLLGGYKDLTDNTLTNLFTITFATTDHLGGGGECHMVFVAKQVTGSVQAQIYRRKVTFSVGHLATTNTGAIDIREDAGAQSGVSSGGGFTAIQHAVNAAAAVNLGTPITLGSWDAATYKILIDSDLTTISQLTCYFHIIYHGEFDITLA